jgi:hypothetical protein
MVKYCILKVNVNQSISLEIQCPHEISPINKPIEVKPTTDRNTQLAALCRATQKVYFLFFFQRSCRQSVVALQLTIRKMASPQERTQCVVWFSKTKSPITVQWNYRRVFEKDPPDKKTIKAWYDKFLATGSVLRQSGSGKKRTSDETVEHVMETFQRSLTKSIRRASLELNILRSAVHKVLHKWLHL